MKKANASPKPKTEITKQKPPTSEKRIRISNRHCLERRIDNGLEVRPNKN